MPPLPNPPVFSAGPAFRKFFLYKLLNACRANLYRPEISSLVNEVGCEPVLSLDSSPLLFLSVPSCFSHHPPPSLSPSYFSLHSPVFLFSHSFAETPSFGQRHRRTWRAIPLEACTAARSHLVCPPPRRPLQGTNATFLYLSLVPPTLFSIVFRFYFLC